MVGSQISFVLEQPNQSAGQPRSLYNETGARRRRAHQKSKRGCRCCKQRRVKCDEQRPVCGQCTERKSLCEYSADTQAVPSAASATRKPEAYYPTPSPSSSDDHDATDLTSREAIHVYVLEFMGKCGLAARQPGSQTSYTREDASELVDHFLDTKAPWIGSPMSQGVVQEHGLKLSVEAPYLMHAILACAASHLSFLHPDNKKYSVAATLHYTRALQAYSAQLVYDLERGNAMAMLCTTGCLAKLSFINTPMLSANIPLATETGPTWVRSMQGVKTIISTPQLKAQLVNSCMVHLVHNYAPKEPDNMDASGAVSHFKCEILEELKEFCTEHGMVPMIYARVLSRLDPLMLCEPSHEMVDKFMAFIATLEPSFIELLEAKETRALLIFSYWCAQMTLIPQWWTAPSARIECRRVCAHLSNHEDLRVKKLLQLPASVCGFELQTT